MKTMKMRTWIAALVAAAATLCAGNAGAQLYAATGSNGVNGNLFTINPATAASTLVAPILVGVLPVSMTGLAVHPTTGVLYGSVAASSPNFGNNLITINRVTGAAVVIGPFGTTVPDLAFNAAGTLFGWHRGSNSLATINLLTGTATSLGASGLAAFSQGGGLAINAAGQGFVSVTGTTPGTLDSVNTTTGAGVAGPALTGAPITDSFPALAFSTTGVLFGVNSNRSGSPTTNFLVTINTATGAVTSIGALPGDTDALAFVPLAAVSLAPIPTLSEWALIMLALLLAGAGAVTIRRRGA